MHAEFSRAASKEAWTDFICSLKGTKLYVLSLEPPVDVGERIIGIDLVLRDTDKPKDTDNLFNPHGNWHGSQRYNFMADDLLRGASGSTFGKNRSIAVKNRDLIFAVELVDVKLSVRPDGSHVIDDLKLSISVDNLPHARRN
jgi:hypothetical protein